MLQIGTLRGDYLYKIAHLCVILLKAICDDPLLDSAIQFSDTVKILGVTLDSNLTLEPHIKAISKYCFYYIRSFRQIRPSMDRFVALAVASALVSARLGYASSILFGCPQKHIISPSASTERTCQSRNAAGLSFFFID